MNHIETHYQQPSPTKELTASFCVGGIMYIWCVFNTFIKISTEDKDIGTTFLLFNQ